MKPAQFPSGSPLRRHFCFHVLLLLQPVSALSSFRPDSRLLGASENFTALAPLYPFWKKRKIDPWPFRPPPLRDLFIALFPGAFISLFRIHSHISFRALCKPLLLPRCASSSLELPMRSLNFCSPRSIACSSLSRAARIFFAKHGSSILFSASSAFAHAPMRLCTHSPAP